MKHLLEVCLIGLTLAMVASAAAAQSVANLPLQRGISVDMAVTNHAVEVPDADREDAFVITIAHDGSLYWGVDLINVTALTGKIRDISSQRADTTLYIKADTRAPYGELVRVLDAASAAGAERLTLLTAQRDSGDVRPLVSPKGLKLRVIR
jgi:biopolymer transport protein ExbD